MPSVSPNSSKEGTGVVIVTERAILFPVYNDYYPWRVYPSGGIGKKNL
jgi:hypothetical protein